MCAGCRQSGRPQPKPLGEPPTDLQQAVTPLGCTQVADLGLCLPLPAEGQSPVKGENFAI